jgi:hypothetical protein
MARFGAADAKNKKRRYDSAPGGTNAMFLFLFFILLVIWIAGWVAFHLAGGLIHILLFLAVVSIIIHFVTGRRAV